MKRLLIRSSLLVVVIGLGTVAVLEAKRLLHRGEPGQLPPLTRRDEEPRPIPLSPDADQQYVALPDVGALPGQAATERWADGSAAGDPFCRQGLPPAEVPAGYDAPAGYTEATPNQYAAQSPDTDDPEPRRMAAEPAAPEQGDPFIAGRAARGARYAPPAADSTTEPADPAGQFAPPQEPAQQFADPPEALPRQAGIPNAVRGQAPIESLPAEAAGDQRWPDNFAPPASAQAIDPAAVAFSAGELRGGARAPQPDRGEQGTGRPGERQLEGSQTPSLTIEKRAPAEIQVGKPATFTILVRNQGPVTAHGVEVHDLVPQGTQLVSTSPPAKRGPQGELIWDLGNMKPAAESTLQVQLLPTAEGEIGSVATIHFRAIASARTLATRALLALDVVGPSRVMIGGEMVLKIKLSNPGTGAATNVVLSETIPAGLKHVAGAELEFEVGTLKPGEQRELDLPLTAAQAGPVTNVLTARAEGNVSVETRTQCEVVAPDLKVGLTGPQRRYLERSAVYSISVSNPGTAPARDVELAAVLPRGLKFIEANNAGQFDAATGAVYWSLEELPAGETGTVTLTALPTEPGELRLHVKGRAQQGLTDEQDETVVVEGIAAILFELVDVNDPIEVGGDTTYEIRVSNQGSKAASDVRLVALLPPQMQALSAEGPSRHVVDGQRVLFDPVGQLAPKADMTYTVKVRALEAGDLRLRVQVVTDEIRQPITKEESTRVYAEE